jgi:MYXO-CTERM domain-containing protein
MTKSRVRWVMATLSLLGCALAGGRQAAAATKVACVGDSITFGAGVSPGSAYPLVLGRLLGAGFGVMNFGDSGSTAMKAPSSSYWNTAAFTGSKTFAPDVVVIMLGTNDSKTAIWRMGNNTFVADYRALIAAYSALVSKPRIFVMLPPPALSPSFTIDGGVIEKDILPLLRKIAAETGAGLIDVFGAFYPNPRRYFGAGDGVDIGDGVHPNDAGARRIAETVFRALTASPTADAGMMPQVDASLDTPPFRNDAAVASADAPSSGDGPPAGADSAADVQPDISAVEADAAWTDARPRFDAAAPPAAADAEPVSPGRGGEAGCHCSAAHAATPPGPAALLGAVVLAASRARRSRRRSP